VPPVLYLENTVSCCDHVSNQELMQRSGMYASHIRDGESTEIEISWPRAETEDVAMNWVPEESKRRCEP